MPDSDQSLEILIKLLSDTKGAEAVQTALDKAKASTEDLTTHLPEGSEAWEKYKGILNQTAQESENLKSGQEVLKLALEKLKLPLHELAPLVMDFGNPAKLAIDGLALAWEIWNKRVEESTKAMAGMQLPDLFEPTAHLSEAQEAMDAYNKSLGSIVESYNSIEAASDRVIKKLQDESKMRKELAKLHGATESAIVDIDQQEAQSEIAEKKLRRSGLIMTSLNQKRMAEDIHVGTQEEDDKNLADAKAQADEAKREIQRAKDNINLLRDAQKGNPIKLAEYYSKVGFERGGDFLAQQQSAIEDGGTVIRKFDEMQRQQEARKKLRARKQKLMEEAGKEQGEADVLGQQIPEEEEALGRKRLPELEKSLGVTSEASTAQSVHDYLGALGRLSKGQGAATDDPLRQHFFDLLESSKTLDQSTYSLLQKLIAQNGAMAEKILQLEHKHDQTAHRTDRPVS